MSRLDDHVFRLQQEAFLHRLLQICRGDREVRMDAGRIGAEIGLPLGRTLEIVAGLHDRGMIHRCGKLNPPDGPEVHLTTAGVRQASPRAA